MHMGGIGIESNSLTSKLCVCVYCVCTHVRV